MKRFVITISNCLFLVLSPIVGGVLMPFFAIASVVQVKGKGFTKESAWSELWRQLP